MKLSKIKHWEEDLKYYDSENIEIKTLLKLTDFRNKKVLDVGCGIGRLTVPISGYAKRVVGLDINNDLVIYCRKNKKRKNISYMQKDIRDFNERRFDIAILAQPLYKDFKKILKSIRENLNEKGVLIIVRWIDEGNDYNALLTPFWNKDKKLMKSVNNFSKNFIRDVREYFYVKKKIAINTYYSYPNKDSLIESIKQDSPKRFSLKDKAVLESLLKKYNYKKIKIAMEMYLCERRG